MAEGRRSWAVKPQGRWRLDRPAELGSILDDAPPATYGEFLDDLRLCAARMVALADAADLVFVGRSTESVHDYLDGLFAGLDGVPALSLMPLSGASYISHRDGLYRRSATHPALRAHLHRFGLSPRALLSRGSVRLVDLVSGGGTMQFVIDAIRLWSEASRLDWRRVRRRLGIVAMTWSRSTSPNAERWWQDDFWRDALPAGAIASVSMHERFYGYVGNIQPKTMDASPIIHGIPTPSISHSDERINAARLARHLLNVAATRTERDAFIRVLAQQPQFRSARVRALAGALR